MKSIAINGQFIEINGEIGIDLGSDVTASLVLPECIVVVIDWKEYSPVNQNVKCFDFSGQLIWTICPGTWPDNLDCPATGIWIEENKLMVYRFCGFEQEIDIKNGQEISCEFTK